MFVVDAFACNKCSTQNCGHMEEWDVKRFNGLKMCNIHENVPFLKYIPTSILMVYSILTLFQKPSTMIITWQQKNLHVYGESHENCSKKWKCRDYGGRRLSLCCAIELLMGFQCFLDLLYGEKASKQCFCPLHLILSGSCRAFIRTSTNIIHSVIQVASNSNIIRPLPPLILRLS